jgi:hypothetical protein
MKALQVIREQGWNEFFKRWKAGVDSITPLQQTNSQIVFTRITLLGIALGFIVSIYAWRNLWWVAIVLGGAFGNTYVGLVALKQNKKLLSEFESDYKEVK